MWKKIVSICAVLFILITSQAHAHVMNADNAYNDLNYTEAKGEILFITALGMTNSQDETVTFRPNDSLTMEELAEFVAAYYHLEGENTAQQVVEKGWISSLKGNATFADVNEAFFAGELAIENGSESLTREAFAMFISEHGSSLIEEAGFTEGPVGQVEAVEQKEISVDGKDTHQYHIQIGDETIILAAHPYVDAPSVDPTVWEGMYVTTSLLMEDPHDNGEEMAQFLSISEDPPVQEQVVEEETSSIDEESKKETAEVVEEEKGNHYANWLFIGLVVVVVFIVVGLYMKKRK